MTDRVRRRRTGTPRVTARTAARRARVNEAKQTAQAKAKRVAPETVAQAKVWDRKYRRYQLAGLCRVCASNAAWGHQCGFGDIPDPCTECQPIVNAFGTSGPRGSKWRKCLIKLEYLSEAELAEVMA
jgi:hypothetical protein